LKIWNTFLVLSMLAGGLAGCASVTISEGPAGEVSGQAAIVATFCTGERWIGLLPKKAHECPEVTGWESEPLFDLGEGSARLQQLARDAGLDRYCLLTPEPETDKRAWFTGPARGGFEALDRDCRGVQPTAVEGEYAQKTAPALAELTRSAIAKPPGQPAVASVRLTLLDTHENGPAAELATERLCSHHGYNLGWLAQEVSCDGSDACKVAVGHRLALGETRPAGEKPCAGGTSGFVSEIGTALWAELVAWDRQPPTDRLVVNLSLGWDGRLYGGFEPEEYQPTFVQTVYRTLELARELEVAVFAAAGNRVAGRGPNTGPLLPAGWEGRDNKHPLAHAVSGLTADGRLLANHRPGALAARASFGGPAVVVLPDGSYTSALTGSSVGTAVASAYAAALWSRFPEDSPAKLVKRLEGLGHKLDWKADEALAKKRPRVRHLAPGEPEAPEVAGSNSGKPLKAGKGISTPYESNLDSDATSEANPQPGTDPCPNCGVDPPGSSATQTLTFRIELAEDWDWAGVQVALEAVELAWGTKVKSYKVADPEWWTGSGYTDAVTLTLDSGDSPADLTGGLLFWTVRRAKGSTSNVVSTSALSSLFLAKEPE
jgi:hypothetical protein